MSNNIVTTFDVLVPVNNQGYLNVTAAILKSNNPTTIKGTCKTMWLAM